MSDSAFKGLTIAETIFKDLVWNPMIKAGEVWLASAQSAIPLLDLPIVQSLEDDVFEKLTDALFQSVILTVDIGAIRLVNTQKQSAYDEASENLSIVAIEKGLQSNEYKDARQKALDALANFGHIGP